MTAIPLLNTSGQWIMKAGVLQMSSNPSGCSCCAPPTPAQCILGSLAAAEAMVINATLSGVAQVAGACAFCADLNNLYGLTYDHSFIGSIGFSGANCCQWSYFFRPGNLTSPSCAFGELAVAICWDGSTTLVGAALTESGSTIQNWIDNTFAFQLPNSGFTTTLTSNPNAVNGCDYGLSSLTLSW